MLKLTWINFRLNFYPLALMQQFGNTVNSNCQQLALSGFSKNSISLEKLCACYCILKYGKDIRIKFCTEDKFLSKGANLYTQLNKMCLRVVSLVDWIPESMNGIGLLIWREIPVIPAPDYVWMWIVSRCAGEGLITGPLSGEDRWWCLACQVTLRVMPSLAMWGGPLYVGLHVTGCCLVVLEFLLKSALLLMAVLISFWRQLR